MGTGISTIIADIFLDENSSKIMSKKLARLRFSNFLTGFASHCNSHSLKDSHQDNCTEPAVPRTREFSVEAVCSFPKAPPRNGSSQSGVRRKLATVTETRRKKASD
jgi:hypothetical protein